MWSSKKSSLVALLVVLLLMALTLIGASCAQPMSSTSSQTSPETTETNEQDNIPSQVPSDGERPPLMAIENMDTVAEILGIDQEVLENAFAQAMSEMFDGDQLPFGEDMPEMTPPISMTPDMELPDGPPSERPSFGPTDEQLTRVAEILGIEQDTLEAAIAEA